VNNLKILYYPLKVTQILLFDMTNLKPEVGTKAPQFTLESYANSKVETFSLDSLKDKIVVLAFYPKDNTPGCTKEMCAFRDDWSQFSEKGIEVFGVSQDSISSHQNFATKFEFGSLRLLSDCEGKLSNALSVGEAYPKRTLFVIGKDGLIKKIIEGMPNNAELLEFCLGL
jgi:peroxiredoxin Q/BCP